MANGTDYQRKRGMIMKIIITEIEANAEELKCSNTLAGSFSNMLRRAFMPTIQDSEEDEYESEE